MGHLIPAGTGLPQYRDLRITLPFGSELGEEEEKEFEGEIMPSIEVG